MRELVLKSSELRPAFVALCCVSGIACFLLSRGISFSDVPSVLDVYRWSIVFGRSGKTIPSLDDAEELQIRLKRATDEKLIVVYFAPQWYKKEGSIAHPNCGNCTISQHKSKINDSRTGAVIFPFSEIDENSMPSPGSRNPDQLHILWQGEPPAHVARNPKAVSTNYSFNATSSYRRNADFFEMLHVRYLHHVRRINKTKNEILKLKKHVALSAISNCKSNPAAVTRLKIILKMQHLGFKVDGFGKCFHDSSFSKSQNFEKIARSYKFYMSFENSYHCRDYITEKVFRNGFLSFAVPVVWGATREDYATFLPEESYIFAEDFDTLESLVEYLNYLDRNDTAYLKYFEWYNRELPPITEDMPTRICQICRAVHGINYDDRHRLDYNPQNPRIPMFSDGIAKRSAPLARSFLYDEESQECRDNEPKNWEIYKKWKL